MTALKPIPNARVVGVKDGQMKLLRKALLNKSCAHPECDSPTDDAHHCFPRSEITNDSWWVEITDDDGKVTVIPHVTGLCRNHHSEVEIHTAWIRLEDGVFNWYDRTRLLDTPDSNGPYTDSWDPVGPLSPQPGSVTAGKKKVVGKKRGEARAYRAQWNVGVPTTERENGADVLDELELAVREKFAAEMGWTETAPRYHIVIAALVKALQ